MKILSKDFLYALENHHNSVESLEGSDYQITITGILHYSDIIANIMRKNIKNEASETMKIIMEYIRDNITLTEVKNAFESIIKSPLEVVKIINEEPQTDICEVNVYLNFEQFIEFLKILVLILDTRSPFTLRHTSTVAAVSRDLAKNIFKNEFDARILYLAGLIHDIGKMRTPIDILHKPGKLSQSEFFIMKLHVAQTYDIFSSYSEFTEITAIASLHHERLDGSGYPWGLNSKDIGMRARILRVADVYSALTEDRPYRKSLTPKEALSIIESEVSRRKLDNYVFEVLKEMIKNGYNVKKQDIVFFEFFKEIAEIDFIRRILKKI